MVYANDICLAGRERAIVDGVIDYFKFEYDIRISMKPDFYLEFLIEHTDDIPKLNVASFFKRLFKSHEMELRKPSSTPLPDRLDLITTDSQSLISATLYVHLIGC